MGAAGVRAAEENRVVVDRKVYSLALQAAVSPARYACTASDAASMLDDETARVSTYNFATHKTTVYLVKVPHQFDAVMG